MGFPAFTLGVSLTSLTKIGVLVLFGTPLDLLVLHVLGGHFSFSVPVIVLHAGALGIVDLFLASPTSLCLWYIRALDIVVPNLLRRIFLLTWYPRERGIRNPKVPLFSLHRLSTTLPTMALLIVPLGVVFTHLQIPHLVFKLLLLQVVLLRQALFRVLVIHTLLTHTWRHISLL